MPRAAGKLDWPVLLDLSRAMNTAPAQSGVPDLVRSELTDDLADTCLAPASASAACELQPLRFEQAEKKVCFNQQQAGTGLSLKM